MTDAQTSEYLTRINLSDASGDLAGLVTLQEHHMQVIPFENLNVVLRRGIALEPQKLFDKVVKSRRGGYCFELNTLYGLLLQSLGYSVRQVMARVWLRSPEHVPPRNHLALLVELDGEEYVTDVGFGGLISKVPLNINDSSEINDHDGIVRIMPYDVNQYMIQRKVGDDWANQYSFDYVDISADDIYISNYYMSTNPKSHFYTDRFVGRFTTNGRIGLFNNEMSTRHGLEVVDKSKISYGAEWLDTLSNRFNIDLHCSEAELEHLFPKS